MENLEIEEWKSSLRLFSNYSHWFRDYEAQLFAFMWYVDVSQAYDSSVT